MLLARAWVWLVALTLSRVPVSASPAGLGASYGHGRDERPLGFRARLPAHASAGPDFRVLDEVMSALKVLQDNYFEPWRGTWPSAIDWTAAVVGTQVSGALTSLSHALTAGEGTTSSSDKDRENLIALYFSQMLGFYFGQNDLDLRGQAYDDMLWVVLGWLETVKFVNLHSHLHFPSGAPRLLPGQQKLLDQGSGETYFGNVWTPAFAHRARIFWELAAKGWDTKWCGGGMNWNPRLQVYKNAITNELFVAASISMYQYFPGDPNESPFNLPGGGRRPPHPKHDQKHLDAAVDGHVWLRKSGMQNGPGQFPEGLYVDGFHISGWGDPTSNNTACDVRNTMVYTYNQGVMLTGLRGLWAVKGNGSYIAEGHHLIRSTINATGYDLAKNRPVDDLADLKPGEMPPWRGLGRAGVLEDQCDVSGSCSQDSQTFKGIFFHHLVAFCGTLEESPASEDLRATHSNSCRSYRGWVEHNAKAAQATRDPKGRFGMWWTAGLLDIVVEDLEGIKRRSDNVSSDAAGEGEQESIDYRSYGVPDSLEWVPEGGGASSSFLSGQTAEAAEKEKQMGEDDGSAEDLKGQVAFSVQAGGRKGSDPNDRGRGRTVETQSGGLAVLRAVWELSNIV
ncbi:hypothetical protein MAPG_07102 [Magnaporthiopsis poae ATCC 64411]|uniref:Glycosyl hydrolase n=1 Tax=Magnaporthiopsis poae (strain ATCC 64411 / 73-15) TaxID=644358 RepID=A0A0C4E3T1_MAGP6|nr:hypothetical protein MAPG_07102 [Magnaporthiopsis poae ATCC 64411]